MPPIRRPAFLQFGDALLKLHPCFFLVLQPLLDILNAVVDFARDRVPVHACFFRQHHSKNCYGGRAHFDLVRLNFCIVGAVGKRNWERLRCLQPCRVDASPSGVRSGCFFFLFPCFLHFHLVREAFHDEPSFLKIDYAMLRVSAMLCSILNGFTSFIFFIPLVNGQWSMPARHNASPFWAQAVKRKTILCTLFWTDSLDISQKLNFASSSHDPKPLYRQKALI